jgi:hypothetical protein
LLLQGPGLNMYNSNNKVVSAVIGAALYPNIVKVCWTISRQHPFLLNVINTWILRISLHFCKNNDVFNNYSANSFDSYDSEDALLKVLSGHSNLGV